MSETPLSSYLSRWERAYAEGRDLPVEELCPRHPELQPELAKAIDAFRMIKRVVQRDAASTLPPVDDAGRTTPPGRPGEGASDTLCPPGYEIVRELGRGGMGVVYLARQRGLNREVALKMILTGEHAGSEERVRFLAEAEAIAAVQHPGIIQVHDYGTHGDLPYFALEYCAGGSLADRLAGTPLPAGDAAAVVAQVAAGVQAAHDRGIVHRDLKPANVLLSGPASPTPGAEEPTWARSGHVPKITDFGLAKRLEGGGNTQTGAVMGTPSYMAPEQAQGSKDVGLPADVYSLGAILYECLTGRPPFKAATTFDTILQVIGDEPVPPRRLNPTTPADLETICLKCLQKEPAKRYGSAQALADDLRRFRAGEPVAARPVGGVERAARWARRRPAVAGLLAGIVGVTAAALVAISVLYANAVRAERAAKDDRDAALLAESTADTARDEAVQAEKAAEVERDAARKAEREMGVQKRSADAQRDKAERLVYAEKLALAEQYWLDKPAVAINLLDECQWALRGWEYHHLRTRFQSNQATCRGHSGAVSDVAFSPDGTRIASAGQDATVRVWDAQTGQQIYLLTGHTLSTTRVAFSPDGTRIASAGQDATVRVWDAGSGRRVHSLKGHTRQVDRVAFSPDGKQIASASSDSTVRVWDAQTGQGVHTLTGHGGIRGLAFSPDGRRIAAGGGDSPELSSSGMLIPRGAGTLKVWDAGSGRLVHTLTGHTGAVCDLAFSSDGRRIASGGVDATVRVWDAATGQQVHALMGQAGTVFSVAISPDGRKIASTGATSVKVWDAGTGQVLHSHAGRFVLVTKVAFSPDGRRIAAGGWDTTVRVWDAGTGQGVVRLKGHAMVITGVAFSPDGKRLASASSDSTVRVWDVDADQEGVILRGHTGSISGVTFSPDGKRIASRSHDGTLRLWDVGSGQQVHTITGQVHAGPAAAFSPDSKRLAWVSGNNAIQVWDAGSGIKTHTLQGNSKPIATVAFRPDGRLVAASGPAKTVTLWDVQTGRELHSLPGHTRATFHVAFSPDGQRIVTAAQDPLMKVWDVDSGKAVLSIQGLGNRMFNGLTFSPDGRRIAAGNGRSSVTVWDAHTGQEIHSLTGHTDIVFQVAFSPDGQRIATGSQDHTVKVWDAGTGQQVLTLQGHTGSVNSVAFSPDGRRIASGSHDATVRVWEADSGQETRSLTGHASSVTSAAASPDGRRIAAGGVDGKVRVWDAQTGQPVHTLTGHNVIARLAFSPDGTRLACSGDAAVKVWDAGSGQLVHTLTGHTGDIADLAFSPNGRRIACSTGTKVTVWDAQTGQLVHTLTGHTAPVTCVAFSPDGTRIAAGGGFTSEMSADQKWVTRIDATVRVWDAGGGQPLLTLKGHTRPVESVAFSPDGKQVFGGDAGIKYLGWDIVPPNKILAWDAETGHLLPTPPAAMPTPRTTLPDGRTLRIRENSIDVVAAGGQQREQDRNRAFLQRLAGEIPAWHLAQIDVADRDGNAFAAAFHRRRLLLAQPWNPDAHIRAAHANARLGNRTEAATHLIRALLLNPRVPLGPLDPDALRDADRAAETGDWPAAARLYQRAAWQPGERLFELRMLTLAQLVGKDHAGSRLSARELFPYLLEGRDLAQLPFIIDSLVLVPLSTEEAGVLVKGAERLLANQRNADTLHFHGIALYRAGRYAEASKSLKACIAATKGGFRTTWPFDCMADHRLGRIEDARRQLQRIEAWRKQQNFTHWTERLWFDTMLAEARALVHAPPEMPRADR